MTRAVALILALGLAVPAAAQEVEDDGFNLMEEGARLFFRGLMDEMEPALEELQGLAEEMEPGLRDFADNMAPALRDLLGKVEDWSVYNPPEVLPNGDIILRRKIEPPEPGAEIDL